MFLFVVRHAKWRAGARQRKAESSVAEFATHGAQTGMLRRLYTQLTGPGFAASFARVAAGSAIVQATGMALALLVGILLARALGAHGLGIYSLAISCVAVLSVPTEFGLPTYLMREVAAAHVKEDWSRLRSVVSWCTRAIMTSGAVVTLLAALVLLLSHNVLSRELTLTVLAALPLVPLVALTKAREATLQGMNLQPLAQIPMLVGRPGTFLAALAFTVLLLGRELEPPQGTLLHSASMALIAIAITLIYRAYAPAALAAPTATFNGATAIRATLPMAMTEGLRVLNGHIAVFLLGLLATPTAVGLFKAADAICLICALPVFVLSNVVGPQIARLHAAGDSQRLRALVSYVALAMTAGSLATALPVIFFGNYALTFLFGPEFSGAQMPLIVLCLGYAASGCLGPSLAFMNLTGRERTVTRSFAASFVASLVFGATAISVAGATGAAIGNVAGYLVWNGWLWHQAKRQAGVDTSLVPAARELISRIGRRA